MFFFLALAYRVFRNPFGAWALLAITIAVTITAFIKSLCWLIIPSALRPDTLRSLFQLAFFAFIPLSLFLGLTQYGWQRLQGQRHRVFFWPARKSLVAVIVWLLLLFGILLFNMKLFPE